MPYLSMIAWRRASPVRQAANLGENVALRRLRYADVTQDEAQHLVVELSLPDEVDGGM